MCNNGFILRLCSRPAGIACTLGPKERAIRGGLKAHGRGVRFGFFRSTAFVVSGGYVNQREFNGVTVSKVVAAIARYQPRRVLLNIQRREGPRGVAMNLETGELLELYSESGFSRKQDTSLSKPLSP